MKCLRSKERNREYMKEYYRIHKSHILAIRKDHGRYYRRQRDKILELLGNKCIRCGMTDKRCLQIDHINGHGAEEQRRIGYGMKYLRHIFESIQSGKKEYQLLCANCNWIKRHERKEEHTRKP